MMLMLNHVSIIYPEIFMLSAICVILLSGIIFKNNHFIYYLSQASLIVIIMILLNIPITQPAISIFYHGFVLDKLAYFLKMLILIAGVFIFCFSRHGLIASKMLFLEFHLLSLFAIMGMMLIVSADNLMVLFLGLELSALPLYTLTAFQQGSRLGSEAAIKYFVMGALASGILLYGFSLLYGVTGSLNMTSVHISIDGLSQHLLLLFALVFVMVGFAFKLGMAPFHLWIPDVYTGAPTPVTLLISTAPKIAALGAMLRLLVDTLGKIQPEWQKILLIIAILSMGLGNISAIMQKNIKRLLAYSSIAHMGYVSLGLISGTNQGFSASLFYISSYSLMAMGAFGLLLILGRQKEIHSLDDLKGLNIKNPWLAFMLLLILFSMAGIPPTVGFFAKLWVLEALVNVHLVWLAILALIFAIIGAYYYINIIKIMYFETPEDSQSFEYSISEKIAITITGFSVLLLGIFPSALIDFCRSISVS